MGKEWLPAILAAVGQLTFLGVTGGARADAERTPVGKPVPFEVHDGYFVSNKFQPDKATSFLAIADQEKFDEVFGVAFVMRDRAHRLEPGAFKTRMVAAAVHRGSAMWQYNVTRAIADGNTLYLHYTAKEGKPGSASFACPLIVSVGKARFASVVFVENDRPVATAKLPDRRSP